MILQKIGNLIHCECVLKQIRLASSKVSWAGRYLKMFYHNISVDLQLTQHRFFFPGFHQGLVSYPDNMAI